MAYQPTVDKTPSVSHWYLQFKFLTKEQCQKFIELLLKEEFDYNFEYSVQKINANQLIGYWVKISDSIHASSLKRVADLLEQVDYEFDEESE